jgi:hypothetical protein
MKVYILRDDDCRGAIEGVYEKECDAVSDAAGLLYMHVSEYEVIAARIGKNATEQAGVIDKPAPEYGYAFCCSQCGKINEHCYPLNT